MTLSRRLLVLTAAVLLLGGLATGLVLRAADRADQPQQGGPTVGAGSLTLTQQDRLTFLNAAQGPHRGALASVPAGTPQAARTASELTCQRFHAAAGTGVCLRSTPGALAQDNQALIVDADLRTRRSFPSRARPAGPGYPRAAGSPPGRSSSPASPTAPRSSPPAPRSWTPVTGGSRPVWRSSPSSWTAASTAPRT